MKNKKTNKYTRVELLTALRSENIVRVEFLKSNGEVRHMKCTRNPKYIPSEFAPKTEQSDKKDKVVTENLEVLSVFDVEKKGWRSFRIESLIEYGVESAAN